MNSSPWREILQKNFTDLEKLLNYLEIDKIKQREFLTKASFKLNLPYRLAEKIEKNFLGDPILLQFLPKKKELEVKPDFFLSPVKDEEFQKSDKLLHKYEGRALLICTGYCAMNCRYCFRKNFDYQMASKSFETEIKLIEEDESLSEIILSGGDPLSLSDRVLGLLLTELAKIPHIKKIRFHTRFPIGIPERIDKDFLALFKTIFKQIWFVIHCNHPKELDDDVFHALKLLHKTGAVILSHTVLLKEVNDDEATLCELFQKMVDHGIVPYYLFQLDKVQGSQHFEVSEEKGRELIECLRKKLPGYAVPKYVKEIAGMPYKNPL